MGMPWDNTHMDPDRLREALAREMKSRGFNMKSLSAKAGLGDTAVRDIIVGRNRSPRIETIGKIAAAMGAPLSALTGEDSPGPHRPPADDPDSWARDLPVLGIAAGSTAGAIQISTDVIEYLRRPPALAQSKDVYVVYVDGFSMSPRFEPGEPVVIHPGRPCRVGDYVVVQVKKGESAETESYIKRLKKADNERVVLEQLNPPKSLTFKRQDVVAMHRILSAQELLGL